MKPPYQILSLRYRCTCKCGQMDGYRISIEDGDDITAVELAIHLDMEEHGWIDGQCSNCWNKQSDVFSYTSLGQNPRDVPSGKWVRSTVSATGNKEVWAEHSLRLVYELISD